LWQRHHFVTQEFGVVLGADVLLPYAVDAPESLLRIPRRRERALILDVDRDVISRLQAPQWGTPAFEVSRSMGLLYSLAAFALAFFTSSMIPLRLYDSGAWSGANFS
jgi:hypothetical protein